MTGKKFEYLCSIFFILLASSILISDVNARSYHSSSHSSHGSSSSGYHGHSTHSGGSPVTHQKHTYPSAHSGGSSGSSSHGYPPSSSHSLSGGSSNSFGGSSVNSHLSSNSLSGSGSWPGSASYPHSSSNFGSTSGSGHIYPVSHPNSLSGTSSGSSYPSTNTGKSGSGHSYPVPQTNSLSGSGSRTGSSSYPSSNSLSGNSNSGIPIGGAGSGYQLKIYPSNTHQSTSWGSSGNVHNVHTSSPTVVHHHHHYDYRPPTTIHFTTSHGMNPVSYPVYRGEPPSYVYEYRSSNNRYSQLLAGLALYNLGKISATSNSHEYHRHYIPQPDEYCKFGVQYKTGNFEEMAIDCRAITYFIYETQPQTQTYTTTNVLNQTTVTTQLMLPNGTLVDPANAQVQVSASNGAMTPNIQTQYMAANRAMAQDTQTQIMAANGAMVSNMQQLFNSVGQTMPNSQQINTLITTTTQVGSVHDPRFVGQPVKVNPDMECYVTRITKFNNMKKIVPCALLQEYAVSSLRKSSAAMVKSSLVLILVAIGFVLH